MFGSTFGAAANQPKPGSTSLFGGNNPIQTNLGGGGTFGATSTTTPAPSLFGQQQTQQQAPQQQGGLFGNQQSSLFGSQQPQQSQQATQQQNAASLFGNQPAQQPGLFGNTQQQNQQQSQQQSQFVGSSSQPQQPAAILMSTKYSELPDNVKKELDGIEKFIQSQINASTAITAKSMDSSLGEIEKETDQIQRKLNGLKNLLKRDWHAIEQVKILVTRELRHSDLISRFIDAGSSHFDVSKNSLNQDAYSTYFLNFAHELENRMDQCRQHIEELEMNIRNSTHSRRLTPTVIQEILKCQYSSFMAVASKVASIHDSTIHSKELLHQYQEKAGISKTLNTMKEATESSKEFTKMAAYLVPSQPSNQMPTNSTFGGSSTFGKPTTGSLFGSNPAPNPSGSLFGSNPAPNPSGSLFGATPAVNPTSSLFGTTPAANPTSSLFGGSSVKRSSSLN